MVGLVYAGYFVGARSEAASRLERWEKRNAEPHLRSRRGNRHWLYRTKKMECCG